MSLASGFYLSDSATGLCIELQDEWFVYGYRCSKFMLYNHMLYHETGKCIARDINGGFSLIAEKCSKDLSLSTKERMENLGHPYGNMYKIFDSRNAYPGNKIYTIETITDDFQPVYTTFGWMYSSNPVSVMHDAWEGSISTFINEEEDQMFYSLRYERNMMLPFMNVESGYIKFNGGATIIKKFCKNTYIGAKYQDVFIGRDRFDNVVYFNSTGNQQVTTINRGTPYTQYNIDESNFNETERTTSTSFENTYQKVNYFEIKNKRTNNAVVMTRSIDCHDQVAKSKDTALKSCKIIKEVCKTAKSGYYWIGGRLMNDLFEVYCEMHTDGGGWMRLAHAFVPATPFSIMETEDRTENLTEWFKSNYTKYLTSPIGLENLSNYLKFDEIRFYCTTDFPGYTSHFKTLTNKYGLAALNYFRDSSITETPRLCNSFHAFADDNTSKGANCSIIGFETDGINGHWSRNSEVNRDRRLYQEVYMHTGISAYGISQIRCHNHSKLKNTKIKNGTFEISVR